MKNKNIFSKINIASRIKKFRHRSHLSVKDVQSIMHSYGHPISFQGYYKWEDGTAIPSITNILILCDIFNITTSTFLNDHTPYKQSITKEESILLSTFRHNKSFKKILTMLYKKEIKNYGENRKPIKNIETN